MRKSDLQFVLLFAAAVICIIGIYGDAAFGGLEVENEGFVSGQPDVGSSIGYGPFEAMIIHANQPGYASVELSGKIFQEGDYRFVWSYANQNFGVFEDNPSKFSLSTAMEFYMVNPANYMPNYDFGSYQDFSFHMFGLDYSSYSDIHNLIVTSWPEGGLGPVDTVTDSLEFKFGQTISSAKIDSSSVLLGSDPCSGWPGIVRLGYLRGNASGHFLGDNPAAIGMGYVNSGVADLIVPEPASLVLLGLGGLLLRKLRHIV